MADQRNPQIIDRTDADWTTARTPEEADMIALLKRAGVQAHEVARHAGHILISASGAKKLAACAPDRARGEAFARFVDQVACGASEAGKAAQASDRNRH